MEVFNYQRALPSCTLHKALLGQIEKQLLYGIPKHIHAVLQKTLSGLGLEDHKRLEHYMINVETKKATRNYACAKELPLPYFERQPKKVKIEYDLGASKFIRVIIIFSLDDYPRLYMSSQSQLVKKMFPKIADGLCKSIVTYGNRHKVLHNSCVQAILLLAIPFALLDYGLYKEVDAFLLCSSMGWLCLLLLALVKSLPQLFPLVTFETKHRLKLNRIPLLAKVALLSVAVACYIALVLMNIPRAENSGTIMLASLFG